MPTKDRNSVKKPRSRVRRNIPEKGWRSLQKTFRAFCNRRLAVLAAFLILCAAFSAYHYIGSLDTASAIMSLDYEEASKGLTPSQTRFNIFEIQSADVLEQLIDYAGLRGKTTAEELSKCISVKATHDKNVSGNTNYISTSYTIQFKNTPPDVNRTPEAMLSLLCKAYREFFVEHYGVNHAILSFDVGDLKFCDEYLTTVDLLELKCNQLGKYVRLRKRESKNYQDPDSGMSFAALERRVDNFISYDLARLRSYIIENGIANDTAGLNAILDYKIRMDRLAYNKLMAAYEEDGKGIRLYDTAMSAVVMIPTQDQNKKYYMSKTKTGMDNMAIHADEQLKGATERMEKISYNTYLTEKLDVNTVLPERQEKTDAMIRQMSRSLEDLAGDIRSVDQTYANAKAHNYLSFRMDSSSFTQRIDPVSSVLGAGLILILWFTVLFLCKFLSSRDEEA